MSPSSRNCNGALTFAVGNMTNRLRHLYLNSSSWSQSIRSYPGNSASEAVEGTLLTATARAVPQSELALKNGRRLEEYDISLSIIQGELLPDRIQEGGFAPDALGGLWYVEDQDFVHGWFYFKHNTYAAVWDQVRTGGYANCTISLGIRPEKFDVWTDNPLSIVSAEVAFNRKPLGASSPDQRTPSRRSWFGG